MKGTTIYMIGIGGIGMSALAQLYASRGALVVGSDREASPTTELLHAKGVRVFIGEDPEHIPDDVSFVVYSDAVHADNKERIEIKKRGTRELSYFEALGEVTREYMTIAVGGSHGKTTTTALLAHILQKTGKSPTAIVGSLVKDFPGSMVGSNFLEGKENAPFVVEACEYNDHILKLRPTILVVTNLEWDHTDYFKSFDDLKKTFIQAVKNIPSDGALVINSETAIGKELASYAKCRVVDYSTESVPGLSLLGDFNVLNAQAAKAASRTFDSQLSEQAVDAALASFKGSWRRFEYIGTTKYGALVYDDYAHHPTEVKATLSSVKKKFPDKNIVIAFHPHLYSRTHDLMDDFATAFVDADNVIIAPIYPAREEPIPGVTNQALAERIATEGTSATFGSFEEVAAFLRSHDTHDAVILTMGAGDIYKLAKPLVQ